MLKDGKIYISLNKGDNPQQNCHPKVKVGIKGHVITHKPPIKGIKTVKIKQRDCYGLRMSGGQSYVTSEYEIINSNNLHEIGGVKKSFLKKLINKFKDEC